MKQKLQKEMVKENRKLKIKEPWVRLVTACAWASNRKYLL